MHACLTTTTTAAAPLAATHPTTSAATARTPSALLHAATNVSLARAAAVLADRHSCLAAPYAATDPRTARYFEVAISKAGAPVLCGFAGKLKGKAIYADRDLPRAAHIWTEAPYLAMQHGSNKRELPACQYCFVPLVGDYPARWNAMVARWNQQRASPNGPRASEHDLDAALERLRVQRRNCGLADAAARCTCGDAYCSKLCQIRAYHEFHAILCPRDDAFSAMSEFIRHTQQTNDIFLLAAKVIARVLSRFLVTQDLVKARECMDMFYKKPWWEVVMIEKHVQRGSGAVGGELGSSPTSDNSSGDSTPSPPTPSARDAMPVAVTTSTPGNGKRRLDGSTVSMTDAARNDGRGPPNETNSSESRFLKDLLVSTHQLLLDALESNLVHLEREDQLHGHSVNEIWTNAASVLSFEFFAAQLGLFEMNNIRVEVDHPFHALMEVLANDDDEDSEDEDKHDGARTGEAHALSAADRELFARVRSVLALEEETQIRQQLAALERDGMAPDGDMNALLHKLPPGTLRGFPAVDGTALFPIICTMNHSCDPNCTVLYTRNGDAHVVAVRDIKKGDELCICYIDVDQDVAAREEHLREYQFRCLCARCAFERRQLPENQATGGTFGTSEATSMQE